MRLIGAELNNSYRGVKFNTTKKCNIIALETRKLNGVRMITLTAINITFAILEI